MTPITTVAVGLGGNIGSVADTFISALRALARRPDCTVVTVSRLYRTRPVGPPQPHFLNAAARVQTTGDLHSLLEILQNIEAAHGRVRTSVRWGPRTLDLDVLWSDAGPISGPRLTVPHPRLEERTFALAPLLDVIPELANDYARALEAGGGLPPYEAWPLETAPLEAATPETRPLATRTEHRFNPTNRQSR